MPLAHSSRLRRSPEFRSFRKRTFHVEPLEGRALMASLLAGPLAASLAPALIGSAPAGGPVTVQAFDTPSGVAVSVAVRIDLASVKVGELLQGIRDLFQNIDALVAAPEPTDALRQAVTDALARIADATGAPQARPVQDLTDVVNDVANTGAITQDQQSQIQSSVATILGQSGLAGAVVLPANLTPAVLTAPTARLAFDPARLGGPYAEALAPYQETFGQADPGDAPLSGPESGSKGTVADPDTSGRLVQTLTELLRTSQAPPATRTAFVAAVAAAARDLPARPDVQQMTQLRQTVQTLTPMALQRQDVRETVARQLRATIGSAGVPPAQSADLTARTLDVASAPGLDAPGFQALFETVLAVLNGKLP